MSGLIKFSQLYFLDRAPASTWSRGPRQPKTYITHTGWGNITSFFEIRAIQAVEVVVEREWSHSRVLDIKFCFIPYELRSCVGTVRSVRFPSRPTFRTDVQLSQPSAPSEIAPPI